MRITIALLLVVCCLLGWWSLGGEAPLPPSVPEQRDETSVTEVIGSNATTSTGTVEATAHREDAAAEDVLHNRLAPELPDDAKWVDVRIVMRDTGEPVADAQVYWINQLQHQLISKLPKHKQPDFRDQDIRPKTYGWRTRSDAEGMIRVSPGAGRAEVIAEKDGLYGRGQFSNQPPPRGGYTLEIEPDLSLKVRVTDANGEPAQHVPVATTQHFPDNKHASRFWWWNRTPVETDKSGIATLTHMQLQQRTGSRHQEKLVPQWLVHVRAVGHDIEPAAIDAQEPPTEPVEFQLPGSGHLRARIMSGNEPVPFTQVMLWTPPGPSDKSMPSYMRMRNALRKPTDKDGWVEYRHVALNKAFYIGQYSWKTEVQGPAQQGATAKATVNLDEHAIVVVGRLLSHEGTQLSSESCSMEFHNDKGVLDNSSVQTTEDGSFLHIMASGTKQSSRDRVRIKFRWDPKDQEGQATELAPRVLHVGRTDLGDIQLQTANLIVSGQVVTSCDLDAPCGIYMEKMHTSKKGKVEWSWTDGASVRVDKDQNFAAYGTLEPGRYRLQVHSQELAPGDPVEFAIGARGLIVERQCGNELQVHCLLPEALDGSRMKLRLRKTGDKSSGRSPQRQSTTPGTADFSWRGLPDGTYALEVRPLGWSKPDPLHKIEGIQLPIDGNRQATLQDMDLRSLITSLEIDFAFADNREDSAYVFLMPQHSEVWEGLELRSGKTAIPVEPNVTEVMFAAWSHEPVTVHAANGRATATLQERPQTNVHVLGLESLTSDYRVAIYVKPTVKPTKDARKFRAGWGGSNLSQLLRGADSSTGLKDGVGTLTLGDGPYRVELSLRHNKTRRSKRIKGVTPNEIVSGNAYQLQVDASELAAVIAEISKPREKKKTK